MGTSNYHSKLNTIYSCLEDLEEHDDWAYDDMKEYVKEEMKEKCKDVKFINFYEKNEHDHNSLRSFPGTIIGKIEFAKAYPNDVHIQFSRNLVIRSGYYDGANLDLDDVEFVISNEYDEIDTNSFNEVEEFIEDMEEPYKTAMLKNLEIMLDKTQEMVEEVYKSLTSPLEVVGTFSNGETVYKEAN